MHLQTDLPRTPAGQRDTPSPHPVRGCPCASLPVVDFARAVTVRHRRSGVGLCETWVRPDSGIRLGVSRKVPVVVGVVRDN